MPARTLGWICIALGLLSCAGLEQRQARDRAALGRMAGNRLALEIELEPHGSAQAVLRSETLLSAPLTEAGAVRLALDNNRRLEEALARMDEASAVAVQGSRLSNPMLGASARFFDSGTEFELGLTQTLVDTLFLAARSRAERFRLRAAQARIAREIVRFVHEVRRAHARARFAQSARTLALERTIALEKAAETMRELHAAGNVPDLDLTHAELDLARATARLELAELGSAEAREELAFWLGLGDLPIELRLVSGSESVQEPQTVSTLASQAESSNLELLELRAKASALHAQSGRAGWEAVLEGTSAGIVAKREASSREWGPGPALGFRLPVFDAGSARTKRRDAQIRAFEARHQWIQLELRAAARRLERRLRALSAALELLGPTRLELETRRMQETLQSYNAMQLGAVDVLTTRAMQLEAEFDAASAELELALCRIDLDELLSGSLPPSAQARRTEVETADSFVRVGMHEP